MNCHTAPARRRVARPGRRVVPSEGTRTTSTSSSSSRWSRPTTRTPRARRSRPGPRARRSRSALSTSRRAREARRARRRRRIARRASRIRERRPRTSPIENVDASDHASSARRARPRCAATFASSPARRSVPRERRRDAEIACGGVRCPRAVRRARARRTLARTPHQFKHPTRARAAVAVADRADDRSVDRVARLFRRSVGDHSRARLGRSAGRDNAHDVGRSLRRQFARLGARSRTRAARSSRGGTAVPARLVSSSSLILPISLRRPSARAVRLTPRASLLLLSSSSLVSVHARRRGRVRRRLRGGERHVHRAGARLPAALVPSAVAFVGFARRRALASPSLADARLPRTISLARAAVQKVILGDRRREPRGREGAVARSPTRRRTFSSTVAVVV